MMFSIRQLADNELLGCCGYVYINWVHRHADLSLYIGWQGTYIDDKGFAEDACRTLLAYGFNELCLNKVWTEIYEFDHKKKALYDLFGFHQDGLLRQNYFHGGKWWDSRILSLLSKEFA
jgi:RimJ/RimL family protein N-acetyltransferase